MSVLSQIAEVKRTREDEARVDARFKANQCLNKLLVAPGSDELVDCGNHADGQRGLCKRCTACFYREVQKGTEEEQADFEREMIRQGFILANDEKRERNRTSAFQIRPGRRKRSAS